MRACSAIASSIARASAVRADADHRQHVVRGVVEADAAEVDRQVVFEAADHHLEDALQVLPLADGAGDLVEQVQAPSCACSCSSACFCSVISWSVLNSASGPLRRGLADGESVRHVAAWTHVPSAHRSAALDLRRRSRRLRAARVPATGLAIPWIQLADRMAGAAGHWSAHGAEHRRQRLQPGPCTSFGSRRSRVGVLS